MTFILYYSNEWTILTLIANILQYTGDVNDENPGTGVMGRMNDVLKQKGLQTSANNVASGLKMLSGDQMFNNPVYTGKIQHEG